MADLEKLVLKIEADTKQIQKELKTLQSKTERTSKKMQTSLKGIQNPLKGLTGLFLKLGGVIAAVQLSKSIIGAGREIEASEKKMAGLVNSTVQFTDELGNAVDPLKNLELSLAQSKKLLDRFREDAPGLAGVTSEQLISASQFALPRLGSIGITDADEQATLIEGVTQSLNQLGLAFNEVSIRQETIAFLEGNVTDLRATFANLVAQVNGGTDAFKANFAEAKKNGTAYEFLQNSISSFAANNALAADSLDNKLSVIQESFSRVFQVVGTSLLPALKGFADVGIGVFFTEVQEGGRTFVKLNEDIVQTAKSIGEDLGKALAGIIPLIEPIFNILGELARFWAKFGAEFAAVFEEEVEIIGEWGQKIAESISFVTDRMNGILRFIKGFVKAFVGLIAALGIEIANDFVKLGNKVAENLENAVNDWLKPINFAVSAINKVFKQDFEQIKLELPEIDNTKLEQGLEEAKGLIQRGQAEIAGSLNAIRFGDPSAVRTRTDTADPLAGFGATSKVGGQEDAKATAKAAKDAAAAVKAAQAEAEKIRSIQNEIALQAQLDDLKVQSLNLENQILSTKDPQLKKAFELQQAYLDSVRPLVAQRDALVSQFNQLTKNKVSEEERKRIQDLINQGKFQEVNALLATAAAQGENGVKASDLLETLKQVLATTNDIGLATGKISIEETKAETKAGELSNTMQTLKDGAKQVGDALAKSVGDAVESGKFDLNSLLSSVLNTALQVAEGLAQSFAGGLFGGGGGAGGLFSSFFSKGGVVKKAEGGSISGSGTSTSDSIPAMLSNGEYVIKASAHKALGTNFLNALNSGKMPRLARGGVPRIASYSSPRFASGGAVNVGSSAPSIVNLNISAMDGADVVRVLSTPQAQKIIAGTSKATIQRQSNRTLQRSTME